MTQGISIYVRVKPKILERIDKIVEKKEYDSRASFIRRAIIEELNREEQKFLA
jgi:metal-responsive CopG/Arc/MetJ family transcriptional regulator